MAMTIERAVEILSEASRGSLTNNAEFKIACELGKQALLTLRPGKTWLENNLALFSPEGHNAYFPYTQKMHEEGK